MESSFVKQLLEEKTPEKGEKEESKIKLIGVALGFFTAACLQISLYSLLVASAIALLGFPFAYFQAVGIVLLIEFVIFRAKHG